MANNDAIERYQAMAAKFPTSEVPHFSLGRALREAGRNQEALRAFEQAISCKPDYEVAWIQKAELLYVEQDLEAAHAAATEALRLARILGHAGPIADCEALIEQIESADDDI